MSDAQLVGALKKIAAVRKAAEARVLASEALSEYEKRQKRKDLLRRLEHLPSNTPLASQARHGETRAQTEARLYREAREA